MAMSTWKRNIKYKEPHGNMKQAYGEMNIRVVK